MISAGQTQNDEMMFSVSCFVVLVGRQQPKSLALLTRSSAFRDQLYFVSPRVF
jgi:hypothetical protein